MSVAPWFVIAIVVLNLGAAVGFGVAADWRRCVFFIAAAILNLTLVV